MFLSHLEDRWLNDFHGSKPIYYRRYVDDIFCIFDNAQDANSFFDYLNSRHPNLQFTMQNETEHKLAFLDVLVDNNSRESIVTSIFHKSTFTGLYTNINSFTPFSYKIGLIKTLVDRCCKVNSTWAGLNRDFETLCKDLMRNCYPRHLIEKVFRDRVNEAVGYMTPRQPKPTNVRYYCIPYIGRYSIVARKRLKMLSRKYCNSNVAELVFKSFKVADMLSVKDAIPFALKSNVVYKFVCGCCTATYIGETTRHISTRMREHLQSDKNSHIHRHLANNAACKAASDESCFTIIDGDDCVYRLKLREAIHIAQCKPSLNAQLYHESLTLLF